MEEALKQSFSLEGQLDRIDMDLRRIKDSYQLLSGEGKGGSKVKYRTDRVASEVKRIEESLSKLISKVDEHTLDFNRDPLA
mmetsp:Transcript_7982/g.7473  ORF Transcript_7982/g.7473 Transcript_7982/m.7473 type:complete len:81 (-) Transcript_7982:32-274(-)